MFKDRNILQPCITSLRKIISNDNYLELTADGLLFDILNFGNWNLFGICFLVLVIFYFQEPNAI